MSVESVIVCPSSIQPRPTSQFFEMHEDYLDRVPMCNEFWNPSETERRTSVTFSHRPSSEEVEKHQTAPIEHAQSQPRVSGTVVRYGGTQARPCASSCSLAYYDVHQRSWIA